MSRLSFSAVNKYLSCPKSYKLHYVDRLRERSATSHLAFGSAIDASLNAVLAAHKAGTLDKLDYKKVFDDNWHTIKINDIEWSLPFCELVGYGAKDFVGELLSPEDLSNIHQAILIRNLDLNDEDIYSLKDQLEIQKSQREYKKFNPKHHQILNYINYLCMRRKGHLMLEAYIRDIVPQITEVVSIQEKVELGDADDAFIGYIDAIVKLKGYPDPLVLDNKTSARPYDEDSVLISQQLATYCYALDLKYAAFGVMLKSIKLNSNKVCKTCKFKGEGSHKTCNNEIEGDKGKKVRCNGEWTVTFTPEASTQLVIDKVPQNFQDVVIDNYGEVADAIKANVFPKNLNTCHNLYGQKCPYLDLCHNGNMHNLVQLDEKK